MRKIFERSTRLILIVSGLMTAGLGVVSISPELFLEKLFKLDFVQDYDIIIRHWSVTIFVIGVFLIISAFNENWRIPIVSLAIIEKSYLVIIGILAMKYPYGKSFALTIPLDAAMCILLAFVLIKEFGKSNRKKVSKNHPMNSK